MRAALCSAVLENNKFSTWLRYRNFYWEYVEGGQDEMATALKCDMNMCGTSFMALKIQVKQGKDRDVNKAVHVQYYFLI